MRFCAIFGKNTESNARFFAKIAESRVIFAKNAESTALCLCEARSAEAIYFVDCHDLHSQVSQ
ncbi:hypothetical protein [Helicobacter sp. 23-1045]